MARITYEIDAADAARQMAWVEDCRSCHDLENALRSQGPMASVLSMIGLHMPEHGITIVEGGGGTHLEHRRVNTSYGYGHGECAICFDGETLCDQRWGHYPETDHKGHAPSGDGRWITYREQHTGTEWTLVETGRGGGWVDVGTTTSGPPVDAPNPSAPAPGTHYPALVLVEWDDTTNIGAWTDLADIPEFARDGFFRCRNVGYLVYEDDACIVLAGRVAYDANPQQVGVYERIPKGVIVSRTVLREPEPIPDRTAR